LMLLPYDVCNQLLNRWCGFAKLFEFFYGHTKPNLLMG
jgi:hypothetical protein